jgi:hypothetical protein
VTKSRGINQPRCEWSPADDAKLRRLYPDLTAAAVAEKLGRRVQQVYARANSLGLSKSDEFKASPASGRTRGDRGQATRFQRGQACWSKGTKGVVGIDARCRGTQFKKGRPANEAHNYQPIGTEKVDRKRGALLRKITDDPAIVPAQRWRPVHTLVWEAAHGAAPAGHMVRFRDGMKTFVASEITLDRLELVTLRENMLRNTIHNYPQPIPQLVQLRGQLTRKINRRMRDEEQDGGPAKSPVRGA